MARAMRAQEEQAHYGKPSTCQGLEIQASLPKINPKPMILNSLPNGKGHADFMGGSHAKFSSPKPDALKPLLNGKGHASCSRGSHTILAHQSVIAEASRPRPLPKLSSTERSPGLSAKNPSTQLPTVLEAHTALPYFPSGDATSSLPTWGTRECPTALAEARMLGHDYTKSNKFPTQKLLLDRELGGLLLTP
ncbi:unnamed protein product [Prunus armeniaca]